MRNAAFSDPKSTTQEATPVTMSGANGMTQGILAQDLMTELMGVVPVLGGAKVSVGFAGDGAFCDASLSYVNIPALPPAKIIPMQIAREIRGFAAHEAAHIAFTDNAVFPSQIIDAQGNYDPLLKEVWNCVEDFMIEKFWLMLYPGARKNFAATEIRCCRGYQDLYQKDPDCAKDLRRVGPVALTWLRAIYFRLGTTVSRECFETMPQSLQARVRGWFDMIEDVETTQDCLDAAREIHADILADPYDPLDPPANPNPQPGQQGQGGQGQGGQGQGQGGQGGQGQGGQGQSSQGQGQQAGGSGSGSGGQGAASGGGDPKQNPHTPIPTSANLKGSLQDAGAMSDGTEWISAEVPSTTDAGPYKDQLDDPAGTQRAATAAAQLQSSISATSAQLRKSLKAIAKDRWKGGRRDGKVDRNRLAGLRTGSLDIYRRKIEGEKIDTAVEILIDCSGSMDGHELSICQQLALVLEGALRGTPIEHEIVGYTTASVEHADPVFQTMVQAHQKRGEDIDVRGVASYEFRKFGASYGHAQKTIGNMTMVPTIGTPTGEGILLAHDRLARRPERRHVLFVLTDGEPDDREDCIKAVKSVEACGVTVVGIGIATDAVKHTFKNYIVIQSAEDLPAVMMSKLSSILIGDKRQVAQTGAAAKKTRRAA